MLRIFGAVLVAALLVGCASPLSGDYAKGKGKTLSITKDVWAGYQEYLSAIRGTNPGYFVVAAVRGLGVGANYRYCPGASCLTVGTAATELVNQCKGRGADECILFAQSSNILVEYKVVDE